MSAGNQNSQNNSDWSDFIRGFGYVFFVLVLGVALIPPAIILFFKGLWYWADYFNFNK